MATLDPSRSSWATCSPAMPPTALSASEATMLTAPRPTLEASVTASPAT